MTKKLLAAIVSAVMLICLAGCSDTSAMEITDTAVPVSAEESTAADETYFEENKAAENAALGNLVLDPDIKYIASLPHDDYRNYVIAEPENSGIIVYGMYNTENIIIEHDGITDIFKQEWYTGRGEPPVSGYGDYDGDSENELALIFDMNGYDEETGFEAKPDVLVLYKIGADGHFTEHRFENAKEIAQNEFERAEAVLGDVIFFDIAHFEPAGSFIEFVAMPEFSKNGSRYISAVVTYRDGEFGLTNYKFGRQEEAAALSDLKLDPNNKFDKAYPIEDYKNYVIVEVENEDIFIYAMYPTDNVIIEHDGMADIFREQGWLTPRRILPRAAYADYDGDGEKELAVSYYVGSGTGISVDELVIYKKDSGGHFTEHKFKAPEDILNEKLTVEIDEENTSVTFTFDGKSVTKNYGEDFKYIKNILSKQEEAKFRFGDIISYNFEGDRITLTGSAGLLTMYYAVGITADVEYADGNFTLTNFEIAEEE